MAARPPAEPGLKDQLAAVEAATRAAVEDLADGFRDWLGKAVDEAAARLASLDAPGPEPAAVAEGIHRFGHDLKGQGRIFGYDLIAALGGSLCVYIGKVADPMDERQRRVVQAHLDAVRIVWRRNIRGDGGASGRQVLAELRELAGEGKAPN